MSRRRRRPSLQFYNDYDNLIIIEWCKIVKQNAKQVAMLRYRRFILWGFMKPHAKNTWPTRNFAKFFNIHVESCKFADHHRRMRWIAMQSGRPMTLISAYALNIFQNAQNIAPAMSNGHRKLHAATCKAFLFPADNLIGFLSRFMHNMMIASKW